MAGLLLFILALIATVLAFTITVAETCLLSILPRTEAEEVRATNTHIVFFARVLTEASTGNNERLYASLDDWRGFLRPG